MGTRRYKNLNKPIRCIFAFHVTNWLVETYDNRTYTEILAIWTDVRLLKRYTDEFDVHVTVHRDKFLIIIPTICTNFSNLFLNWKSTCFGQFLCPPSRVSHCTHSNDICHCSVSSERLLILDRGTARSM